MFKVIVGPLPILIPNPVLWVIRKLLENLPAVLLPQVLALLDQVMDPRTTPWKRAAIAALLLELVALINASVPMALIVRFLVLNAAFGQQSVTSRSDEDREKLPRA